MFDNRWGSGLLVGFDNSSSTSSGNATGSSENFIVEAYLDWLSEVSLMDVLDVSPRLLRTNTVPLLVTLIVVVVVLVLKAFVLELYHRITRIFCPKTPYRPTHQLQKEPATEYVSVFSFSWFASCLSCFILDFGLAIATVFRAALSWMRVWLLRYNEYTRVIEDAFTADWTIHVMAEHLEDFVRFHEDLGTERNEWGEAGRSVGCLSDDIVIEKGTKPKRTTSNVDVTQSDLL